MHCARSPSTLEAGVGDLGSDLDLNVALAVRSPGHMAQVPWTVALYLDDHGLEWELSEKNGFFSPFAYRS